MTEVETYDEWEVVDPMHEPTFDEENAFPQLKPSANVFGVPLRSRKQRGWYQVQQHPQPMTQLASMDVLLTVRPTASAACLPVELIHQIGESLIDYTGPGAGRPQNPFRDEYVWCARVCRHWAKVMQPRLFAGLQIGSHSEMVQLLDIRRTSLTGLAQSDPQAGLRDSLDGAPFTHLAPHMKPWNSLTITGPLPTSQGTTLRSIHGRVPRSLPTSASASIGLLTLRHIHFRYFADLVKLLSEASNVRVLTAIGLTWPQESEPYVVAKNKHGKPFPDLCQVTLNGCTTRQSCLALLLTTERSFSEVLLALTHRIDNWLPEATAFRVVDCVQTPYGDLSGCLTSLKLVSIPH